MTIVEQPYEDSVTIRQMLTWPSTPTEQRYTDATKEYRKGGPQNKLNAFRPKVQSGDAAELQRMLQRTSFEKKAARQYVNAIRGGTENIQAALSVARSGCSAHTIGLAVAMAPEDKAESLMTAVTYLSRDPDWMGMNPHLQMIKPTHITAIFEATSWDFADGDHPGWVLIGPAPYMERQISKMTVPQNPDTENLRKTLSAWGQTDHCWMPTRSQDQ